MDERKDYTELAIQKLTEFMESQKMRKTPERYEVMRIVCLTEGLFTIDELAEKMKEDGRFCVSRATLFNTLDLLVEAKLVVKHILARAAHYECNIVPHPMICTICYNCGAIRKCENAKVEKWMSEIKTKMFAVSQPVLYLHGLCRSCATKTKNKQKNKTIRK